MAAAGVLCCHYCSGDFYAPSERLLLNHIRLVHLSEPGFSIQCSRNGCCRTFKNFRTYQNHLAKHHKLDELVSNNQNGVELYGHEGGADQCIVSTDTLQSYAVKWLLKTRETRYLTRAATQGIIEDVQNLMDVVTQSLRSETEQLLMSRGIDPTIVAEVNVFSGSVTRPFENVTSFHQQLQYCRKHFGFVVRLK